MGIQKCPALKEKAKLTMPGIQSKIIKYAKKQENINLNGENISQLKLAQS